MISYSFQEAYIAELDAKSGASLKLTVLNPKGRVWTMVAGGGASVIYRFVIYYIQFMLILIFIYSDTICDMGFTSELANYGEYSGAPSEQQTYEYAKTVLSLIVKEKHPDGKVLIIGGGIANFTNVAATFKVLSLFLYRRSISKKTNKLFLLGYCKSVKRISRSFNRG